MRIALNVAAVTACAFAIGCDIPDYKFGSNELADANTPSADGSVNEPAAATPDAASGCATDFDCVGTFGMPYCQVSTGKCVACLTNDRCGRGQWCNNGTCVPGCNEDLDCAVTTGDAGAVAVNCDPATHLCVGCEVDEHCPLGFLCKSDGVCRPGCTATRGCDTGRECCSGSCIDTTRDAAHCGGCGLACEALAHTTMKCEPNGTGVSVCKIGACAPGWADCNGVAADGCETNIATSRESCGACGKRCNIANGWGVCDDGSCKVASCNAGFANCDGSAKNGCEVNLNTNPAHCGACNNDCPNGTAIATCVGGVCKLAMCSTGYGDCDGSGACATGITDDVNNCGACGNACVVANAATTCTTGACSITDCDPGFGDCNANYADGCEQKLDSVAHCGACGTACTRANAAAMCAGGSCKIASCNAGYGNCDLDDLNGCEVPLNDVNNCGACSRRCAVTNGTAACASGVCTLASCSPGFVNCDSNATDCERNLTAATNTCATAQQLLDSSNLDPCGYGSGDTITTPILGTRYYRVRLGNAGCSNGTCKSATDPVRARITLKSPSGIAHDLRVFADGACSAPLGASISGALGGTETVTYDAKSCSAPKDLWIEVKFRAGASCAAATLTINSAYVPYP